MNESPLPERKQSDLLLFKRRETGVWKLAKSNLSNGLGNVQGRTPAMRASIRVALLATVASCFIGSAFADDLVTKDRVGPADAPKTLVLRLTGDGPGSTEQAWADGYTKLYGEFIQRHPGWQIKLERMSDKYRPGTGPHARADEVRQWSGLRFGR
jgi:hypothetical protein